MKKHLYVLAFLAMLGFVSCTNTAPKSNSEVVSKNAPSISQDSILLNPEHIKSLIAADQAERNLWSYCIKESDYSPAFYEAIGDDGLDLYRVCTEGNSVYVVMMEDRQTYGIKDYIDGPTLSAGVEYEHDGHYEIIDDYTVDIIFDEWCRNYSSTNDSATLDPIYHMRCVHRYGLNNRIWNSIKKDTAILLDKRCDAFCGDKIWEYTH